MPVEPIPIRVRAEQKERVLVIHWKDGHISKYPYWLVRAACPCADCRGGHDQMSNQPPEMVFDEDPEESIRSKIKSVYPVGSYALGFNWEDGHSAGIYNWSYLRHLCPCPECRSR